VVEVSDTVVEDELESKEQSLTPEEAQKNTRKAPQKVESEGTPPPPDDEEPGAGSDVTELG